MSTVAQIDEHPSSTPLSKQAGTYVTFDLAGENLGVEVTHVREILDTIPINRLPNSGADMECVVDIRGESIPIVNMGSRLGLPRMEDGEDTRIIVFEIRQGSATRPLGVLADKVRDVTRISSDQIESPPVVAGSSWRSDMLIGIARHGELFILLLDIQSVFNGTSGTEVLDPSFL